MIMAAAQVAQPEEPPKMSFTLTSLREASMAGQQNKNPNPFVFKKFAMHLKKDVLLKSKKN